MTQIGTALSQEVPQKIPIQDADHRGVWIPSIDLKYE